MSDGVRSRPMKFNCNKRLDAHLSLSVALSPVQVTICFRSTPPQFQATLSSPFTNLTRGSAARRLFRVDHAAESLHIYKKTYLLLDSYPERAS
ncbi:hypothetical protein TNCV_3938591 [Trichonephila clavipes]|nr:hypothetical protein TNCV_3938591 [Trichonephila clavipes]